MGFSLFPEGSVSVIQLHMTFAGQGFTHSMDLAPVCRSVTMRCGYGGAKCGARA